METALLHSWNVNGLRAAIRKGFGSYVARFEPDVLCLQEIKCPAGTPLPEDAEAAFPHKIWHPAAKPGYSGTAVFSKFEPISVAFDFAGENHPEEGRVITAEFPRAFVVCAYVPNSQNERTRAARLSPALGRGFPRTPASARRKKIRARLRGHELRARADRHRASQGQRA